MSKRLAEVVHANIHEVGLPEWTEANQQLARAVQAMMAADRGNDADPKASVSARRST